MIEYENWEITNEPLAIIAADDPVTCAIYDRESIDSLITWIEALKEHSKA
jgi:hypothetical protein